MGKEGASQEEREDSEAREVIPTLGGGNPYVGGGVIPTLERHFPSNH